MTGFATRDVTRKLSIALRRITLGRVPKLFDAAYYLRNHPDAAASGLDPFLHYVLIGTRRGYDPNGDFDTTFYQAQAKTRRNPLLHYIKSGAAQGFDPHPHFSTLAYLGRYPDVVASKVNPLLHYRENGRPERRVADPSTRVSRTVVALAGVPSNHHWTLPRDGQTRFDIALLRTIPGAAEGEPIARLCLSLSLDFDAVDGFVDVVTRFPTGTQDIVQLAANADPVRGGGRPSLILAFDHCYFDRSARGGTRIVTYAQASLWDIRPTVPRVLTTLSAGAMRV